jgi:hypothetical protein
MEIDYKKLAYYRTKVPIFKTQNEIRTILQKFNLQGIRFTEYQNMGIIEFILLKNDKELMFRFKYNLPESESLKQQVFRALYYYLKNRFMAIEFGIVTIEKEFLQELVLKLPNGSTTTIKEMMADRVLELQYNDLKHLEGGL